MSRILKKCEHERTGEEIVFLEESKPLIGLVETRVRRSIQLEERKAETEDQTDILIQKSIMLADAIKHAKYPIVYTGAGILAYSNLFILNFITSIQV